MEIVEMALADGFNSSTGMMPDMDIVKLVLEGDSACFELIMRRYNLRMYRIARAILRNEADAEDVVQDAYLRAYENLGRFQGTGPLSALLAKITVNEALGRLRRTGFAGERISLDNPGESEEAYIMADLISSLPSPEQSPARRELRRIMESAIDALPNAYRSAFIL